MKRTVAQKKYCIKYLLSISLCVFVLWLFCPTFVAKKGMIVVAEPSYQNAELEENIKDQLEHLDLRALQEYVDSLGGFSDKSVKERLLDYIRTEGADYEGIRGRIGEIFFAKVLELAPSFACITAVALLSGLLSMLKSDSAGQSSSKMISLITYAGALIPLLGVITECFTCVIDCVSSMKTQMDVLFPLMLTLMSVSGEAVTASVCKPAVAFFSTGIVSVIESVVFPLTLTIIVFSIAGNLSSELKIGKFTAFFKSINKWVIGISVSVFGIFFTLQGITSATYDGVVRRATKYALGNGIPIIGGFLSGGFDLAVAGGVLIKNSLGSMGIFLLISVLFEPISLLIAVNVTLRLTSAISQPFGDGKISDFLGDTAENLHYCTAGLLFTAFLYFLTIMVMIFATEALL